MISIDYTLNVKGFSLKEIGYATLVRNQSSTIQIKLTNDGQALFSKLNVKLALECYVGQEKPQLFQWHEGQVTEIPPKAMVPLTFRIKPVFLGLVSVAVYMTDAANNVVMAKRANETNYEREPVRWWFHVADDISIETLKALKQLVATQRKGIKK